MDLLITENDSKHPPTSTPVEHMDSIDLETDTEQLERQVEELTKQLNESMHVGNVSSDEFSLGKLAEKHAKEECEKYFQLYNETKQSLLTFENQQLNQIRRILNTFTTDQPETLSSNTHETSIVVILHCSPLGTSENLSCTFESLSPTINDQDKTDLDWNDILAQVRSKSQLLYEGEYSRHIFRSLV